MKKSKKITEEILKELGFVWSPKEESFYFDRWSFQNVISLVPVKGIFKTDYKPYISIGEFNNFPVNLSVIGKELKENDAGKLENIKELKDFFIFLNGLSSLRLSPLERIILQEKVESVFSNIENQI